MTQEHNQAKTDAALLYQLAEAIESGAYVSTLRVHEFIEYLSGCGAFKAGFDPFAELTKFDFDQQQTVAA